MFWLCLSLVVLTFVCGGFYLFVFKLLLSVSAGKWKSCFIKDFFFLSSISGSILNLGRIII